MKRRAGPDLSKLCALLFLFSLMIFAAFFYVGNMAVVAAERDRSEYLTGLERLSALQRLADVLEGAGALLDEEREALEDLGREKEVFQERLRLLHELDLWIGQLRSASAEKGALIEGLLEQIAGLERLLAEALARWAQP
ncbi:MAG: hypothetical protein HY721_09545 [Planctomycetes bacterium]|nr:hypothetical protein [Planctomycetota bacterium]